MTDWRAPVKTDTTMLTPLPQRSLPLTTTATNYSDKTDSTTKEETETKLSLDGWMPALQKMCSELESFLVLELIQGMMEAPPGLGSNIVDVGQLRQITTVVHRIEASLNHLETVTTIKALRGDAEGGTPAGKCQHRISAASTHSGEHDTPNTVSPIHPIQIA